MLDDLNAHLREADDATLQPLTPMGAFHIAYLRLNRPELIALCRDRLRVETAQRERQELLQYMRYLEQRVETLKTEVDVLADVRPDDV